MISYQTLHLVRGFSSHVWWHRRDHLLVDARCHGTVCQGGFLSLRPEIGTGSWNQQLAASWLMLVSIFFSLDSWMFFFFKHVFAKMGTQLDVLRFLFLWHCLCGWLPPPEWQPDESRGSTTLSFRTFGSSRAARVWNRLVVSTFQNLYACRKEVCMLISPMTFILFWKGLKVKHQPSSFEILFVHWQEDRPEKCESELSLQSDVMHLSDETWWSPLRLFKFHIDHIG